MCNYISQFETYLQQNKKASQNTVTSYIRDITAFNAFEYLSGKKDITKCVEKDVTAYISHLKEDGKSSSTIVRAIASLRSFYTFLMTKNAVKTNPTKGIKSEKQAKKLPRILTNKEVDLFLSQPKGDSIKGYRDKAMLEILYATGIRVSELIALNVNDVNTLLGFVKCGKTNNERVIPIYSTAVSTVEDYLNSARPLLITNPAETALFVNLNGTRITRQGFWKIIKYYQEKANIKTDITPHVLRHSFAAHLLENGADIEVIKEMMGHSDISSTLVYAQLIKNNLKSSYIKFHPRA